MGCCGSKSNVVNGYNTLDAQLFELNKKTSSFVLNSENQRTFILENSLYVEEEKLGSGSFSDVFLYRKESEDTLHALKILKDSTTREALIQECKIMREVQCLYVIQIEEIIQIDDKFCILMEYANQGTLETFLQDIQNQQISINSNQILDLACDIFQGLNILHEKKIVHRDLKMQNLLVSNYQIKIADLGVAAYLISKSFAQTNVGNFLYAAPEKSNEKYNSSVDIYSAGLIILQIITSLSNIQILKMKVNNNYSTEIEDSPETLKRFLEQLLDQNADSRPDALSAYNQCRALKYDQDVLDYINSKLSRINQNIVVKNNQNFMFNSNKKQQFSTGTNSNQIHEEELFQKGMEFIWDLDLITAEKCFQLILQKNPASIKALCGRFICGIYFSDWINMKEYTNSWLQDQLNLIQQINSNDYMYHFCSGIINQDIDSLNDCLELNPGLVEAIALKGSLLIDNNQIQEAIQCGQQALNMSVDNPFVLRLLGYIYLNINKDISENYYLKSLEINPNQYLIYHQLGKIYKSKKKNEVALQFFDKCLFLCPHYKFSIQEKLKIMREMKIYYEIIAYIQNIFSQLGELNFLYFDLGYSYQQVGDKTKSLLYYSKSLIDEEEGIVLNNIGVIYRDQQQYDKAKEYFMKSMEKQYKPSFLNMYYMNINLLNYEENASQYLNEVLELDFDEDDEYDCKQKIEAKRLLKLYDEALDYSEQVLKEHPSSQVINFEILKLVSDEDFSNNLLKQYKISEQIQKSQGITYDSTICSIKYFSNNGMHDIVATQILNYIQDISQKQIHLLENYELPFSKYMVQDQLEHIFYGLKKMSEDDLYNYHYKFYFFFLIFLMNLEFSYQMIQDLNQVFDNSFLVLQNHLDQDLIKYLSILFQCQVQYYLFQHNDKLYLFSYEKLKNLLDKMNTIQYEVKLRFIGFHQGYNEILGFAITVAETLYLGEQEVQYFTLLRKIKRDEALIFFSELKDQLEW